jgi:hypothetical protein
VGFDRLCVWCARRQEPTPRCQGAEGERIATHHPIHAPCVHACAPMCFCNHNHNNYTQSEHRQLVSSAQAAALSKQQSRDCGMTLAPTVSAASRAFMAPYRSSRRRVIDFQVVKHLLQYLHVLHAARPHLHDLRNPHTHTSNSASLHVLTITGTRRYQAAHHPKTSRRQGGVGGCCLTACGRTRPDDKLASEGLIARCSSHIRSPT